MSDHEEEEEENKGEDGYFIEPLTHADIFYHAAEEILREKNVREIKFTYRTLLDGCSTPVENIGIIFIVNDKVHLYHLMQSICNAVMAAEIYVNTREHWIPLSVRDLEEHINYHQANIYLRAFARTHHTLRNFVVQNLDVRTLADFEFFLDMSNKHIKETGDMFVEENKELAGTVRELMTKRLRTQ
jgi:hypothetical protein